MTASVSIRGWLGRRSLGDDLFAVAADRLLSTIGLRPVAVVPGRYVGALMPSTRVLVPPRIRGALRSASFAAMLITRRVIRFGGSTLQQVTNEHVDELRAVSRGARLDVFGVSVGPFARERAARDVLTYLEAAATVAVRDYASVERVRALSPGLADQIAVVPDPALLPLESYLDAVAPAGLLPGGTSGTPSLVVSVIGDQPHVNREAVRAANQRVLDLGRKLGADSGEACVLVANDGPAGDTATSVALAAELREDVPYVFLQTYSTNPSDTLAPLVGASRVVGTRLHVGIASAMLGAATTFVPYASKCRDVVDALVRGGYTTCEAEVDGRRSQGPDHTVAESKEANVHGSPRSIPTRRSATVELRAAIERLAL